MKEKSTFLSLRSSLSHLIVGVVVFILCNIYCFPISKTEFKDNDVKLITNAFSDFFPNSNQMYLQEKQQTGDSVFYLFIVQHRTPYLVQVEKSIIFSRYRILPPITLNSHEMLVKYDFWFKYSIYLSDQNLNIQTNKYISKSIFLALFILFVLLSNVVTAIFLKWSQGDGS